jgi:ceramide glucosyltransferase
MLEEVLMTVARLLLFAAEAGLASCTVFLLLVAISAARFRHSKKRQPSVQTLPAVTLLKPLCGLEPSLEENLESFFRQDYPDFEIIFGTRDGNDPALEILRRVLSRHPQTRVKIVVSGKPLKPNAKVCSLAKMAAAASTDYFVISDSDVRVGPNYLREVVPPLLDPAVGLVTCLYRGVPSGSIWSVLEALGMSVEMTAGVLVAGLVEGMQFALGPTMAIRREVLECTVGWAELAEYCADDYILGNAVYQSGRNVVLSHHVIDHVAGHRDFKSSILHQIRWAKSTRFSRPVGHPGTVMTFAMPFGLIGMVAALSSHHPLLSVALVSWAVCNRVIMALVAGAMCVGDARSIRYCWLYPVRDLMGFMFWCSSFLGRNIVWRGELYRLEFGGRMTRAGTPTESEQPSSVVAIDNLA